ncbi:type 1 glutamine amidotransferase [Aquabacter sp. P-9]|uniref:type 1 glutamine amidotransferase n=1 Tax=Aquabacter sediminis TaxID=3029197 RepID=UPI00237EBD15|nr:type 1 glutamine amidotransferase [Aquabacter sp. P-9]MDE1570288.1 type 1 glutamine amidotransferase [Aquabacter sp. P-9]
MKFLVLQHAASEHPGSLRDLMHADGFTWDAVELDEGETIPDVSGYDALLVLGGPMDVWEEDLHPWLATEKRVIRDWVTAGRPFLGICLGHQLLAEAMGGEVGRMAEPEVGVCQVALTAEGAASPLFAGFPQAFPTLQWHGAAVLKAPAEATVLAHNFHCAIQAMQIGRRAFGIQYHVELIDTTVSDWGAIPEYRCALESITGPGGQARLEAAAAENMEQFRASAARLYANFRATL